jgi:3-methyladenine DNA glycosylase AlkC
MAERLVDQFFTAESLLALAEALYAAWPDFERAHFLALTQAGGWETLALKARMRRTTEALHAVLPEDYPAALEILRQAAPVVRGFEAMCFPDYVELYGRQDWERSLPALAHFTRFGSSEFALRPFLDEDPQRGMAYLREWALDENEHVRRLASEGCRPRLPWAMALPKFKRDPALILPVLDRLKDDPSAYVRRSVANNLNDISKDHPEVVLDLCEGWYGNSTNTDWIVRQALRSLLKAGNRRALRLFGFGAADGLQVSNLALTPQMLRIGESLALAYELQVSGAEAQLVRLEYAVEYVKARGQRSRKVFQHSEKTYAPGFHRLDKAHSFADRTTRKHYPGAHRLTIIVNGEEQAGADFWLEEA